MSAHAHVAMALWAVAIMFIQLRWSRMWEWKPRLYRWALVFQSIGVIVTLFGTAVVPVWRPIAHQNFQLDRAPPPHLAVSLA